MAAPSGGFVPDRMDFAGHGIDPEIGRVGIAAKNEIGVAQRQAKRIAQRDGAVGLFVASLFFELIGLFQFHLDGPLDGDIFRPWLIDEVGLAEFAAPGFVDDHSGIVPITKDDLESVNVERVGGQSAGGIPSSLKEPGIRVLFGHDPHGEAYASVKTENRHFITFPLEFRAKRFTPPSAMFRTATWRRFYLGKRKAGRKSLTLAKNKSKSFK